MGRILKGARLVDGKWLVSAEPVEELVTDGPDAPEAPIEPAVDPAVLVAEARAEAERILAEAHSAADALRAAAQQEGYQLGLQEGERAGRDQWQAQVMALAEEARSLLHARQTWYREAENEVVRLSLLIAERILHQEARNPEAVTALVRALLVHLGDAAIVRLRVHPADVEALARMPELAGFIKPDSAVGLGGCVIETQTGRVDARFATQFRELAHGVLLADPEEDPILGPVVSELALPTEAAARVADAPWKRA